MTRARAEPGRGAPLDVNAVVVDYDAGEVLASCVASLVAEGVSPVVVVENGEGPGAHEALQGATDDVAVIVSGLNIGYGAGVNRGVAATASQPKEFVLICNPDIRVHAGAVDQLVQTLRSEPAWAIVGPKVLDPAGRTYPSVRRFPSLVDAAGHAIFGKVTPDNPFTRRYRTRGDSGSGQSSADWVSGACLMARRSALEQLGGFDEAYFMFAEDMDLCWRAHQAGWGVGYQPAAEVTHVQGVSTRRHPYRMLVAHHRSALRFVVRSTEGWRRAALPLAALLLGARLVAMLVATALRSRLLV